MSELKTIVITSAGTGIASFAGRARLSPYSDAQRRLLLLTPFAEITPTILQRTLAVNLSALFWLAQGSLLLFER